MAKSRYTVVWDQTTLKKTTYFRGKYYASKQFANLQSLIEDKTNSDIIQEKREANGREPINHIIKKSNQK